ncbi:MAG TPA: VWA domain-containing protein [Candidatus Acidoferrum sp.]|jgi:VWFA-related protein
MAAQQASDGAAPQAGTFKIQVGVNSVLVPVVVRDGKGRVVGDLKEGDFQIFDQDKAKAIAGFTVQRRAVAAGGAAGAPGGSGTTPFVFSMAPPAVVPQRFIVFLFDDMHFQPSDLLRIKRVATKMLGESLGETDMAAVVTTSGTNSGATRDRAVLDAAVEKISVHSLYQHDSHECPPISVYQADLIVNKHNEQALESGIAAYGACAHVAGGGGSSSPTGNPSSMGGGVAVDSDMSSRMVRSMAGQILEMGDRDIAVTLSTVKEYVRRMGQLPGQHVMILFSPGFVTVTQNAMIEKSEVLDLAARSNVTISAMDTRGLYTTNMDASERGGASARDLMTGEMAEYHSESMNLSEDVMAEFANGSGGKFFHNNNDLEGGFKELTQAPEYLYILEMSLDQVKADGTYHRLKVKVDRDALKVEARRGYFAPRAEKKKK